MKHRIITALLIFSCSLFMLSCQTEASKAADKARLDSLDKQTQHAMDSSEDELMKMVNSTDDSDIVNDPNAPVKEEKK